MITVGLTTSVVLTISGPIPTLVYTAQVVNGVAVFNNLVLTVAGVYGISALNPLLPNVLIPTSLVVVPSVPTQFLISAPTTVTSGAGASIAITAKDAYGNLATNYTGTVTVSTTDLQLSSFNYTFTSGTGSSFDNGMHVFSVPLMSTGPQMVTVHDLANQVTITSPEHPGQRRGSGSGDGPRGVGGLGQGFRRKPRHPVRRPAIAPRRAQQNPPLARHQHDHAWTLSQAETVLPGDVTISSTARRELRPSDRAAPGRARSR